MTKLEEIEKAVSLLSREEFSRFREWFEELEAKRFDEKIEQDAKSGRLDELAEKALADHRAGRTRPL